jgi:hypothetical protein
MQIIFPDKIFLTGVPGSKWGAVVRPIEGHLPNFNTTDQTPNREFITNEGMHKGAYFGKGMEFEAILDEENLLAPFASKEGTKFLKSHEWAYKLANIQQKYSKDWIMMVYRPDESSFHGWRQAGGFNIPYPKYDAYDYGTEEERDMHEEIVRQNRAILKFGYENDCMWEYPTLDWYQENFGFTWHHQKPLYDVLVTIIRP